MPYICMKTPEVYVRLTDSSIPTTFQPRASLAPRSLNKTSRRSCRDCVRLSGSSTCAARRNYLGQCQSFLVFMTAPWTAIDKKNPRGCEAANRYLSTDIHTTITKCTTCAQNRLSLRRHTTPLPLFPSTDPLTEQSVDIVGPIPASKKGNRFILDINDRFAKLPRCVA